MSTPIISRFRESPKRRVTWWAFGLSIGLPALGPMLGISAAVIVPAVSRNFGEGVGSTFGFSVGLVALLMTVVAAVFSTISFRVGERSWVMWCALIPAVLGIAFWIFMLAGELLFPH